MSLIGKRLAKLPVGTQVELTVAMGADRNSQVTGIIADSDFESEMELQQKNGQSVFLDFSLVRGLQVKKTLEAALKELQPGTRIRFSCGDSRTPDQSGTVTDSDGEESMAVRLQNGQDILLRFSLVRSLLTEGRDMPAPQPVTKAEPVPVQEPVRRAEPVPAPEPPPAPVRTASPVRRSPEPAPAPAQAKQEPLYSREAGRRIKASDRDIKASFNTLSKAERKKLNGSYDSFQHGARNNDASKMKMAASAVRQRILREAEKGTQWNREVWRFCGCLLARAGIPDYGIFMNGDFRIEAAEAAWREGLYSEAEACALLGLMDSPPPDQVEDLLIYAASGIAMSGDITGLHWMQEQMPDSGRYLKPLVEAAAARRGLGLPSGMSPEASLNMLDSLYPGTGAAREMARWTGGPEPEPEEEEEEEEPAAEPEAVPEEQAEEELQEPADPCRYGAITKLIWITRTGSIEGDDGKTYQFTYGDFADTKLKEKISSCTSSNLNGKPELVVFLAEGGNAKEIAPDPDPVARAAAIAGDEKDPKKVRRAMDLCRAAISGSDPRWALQNMLHHGQVLCELTHDTAPAKECIALYEKMMPKNSASTAFMESMIAQLYFLVKNWRQMTAHADRAIAFTNAVPQQRTVILSLYMDMFSQYYDICHDRKLQTKILHAAQLWEDIYAGELSDDRNATRVWYDSVLPAVVRANCILDRPEEAEKACRRMGVTHPLRSEMEKLIAETRERLAPAPEPEPVPEPAAEEEEVPAPAPEEEETAVEPVRAAPVPEEEETEEEEEEEKEIESGPYEDRDGWAALNLTREEAVNRAFSMKGEHRIPHMLAYLRAAADLNPEILPVYRMAALAADDPMESPDYSVASLLGAMEQFDPAYPLLGEYAMAAAFLRSSFRAAGQGYNYEARSLRSSISLASRMPVLQSICSTLEEFREETGQGMDLYADCRNRSALQIREDLEQEKRKAGDLYTRFVLTPFRDRISLARLLETRKILFARDGWMARMLQAVIQDDQATLEQERDFFCRQYLGGSTQFAVRNISTEAVDRLIMDAWERAQEPLTSRKFSSTLQGTLRNNLRSNIGEVLSLLCRVYALTEASAGFTWRTEKGQKAYESLKPRLLEDLEELRSTCDALTEDSGSPEEETGLVLLSATARELSGRLDGSWDMEAERFFYADFLDTDLIPLDENWMPDLSATFCALPDFNILARIQAHGESRKLGAQEHLNLIYSPDRTRSNYGTADRILELHAALGDGDELSVPDGPESFEAQSEMQARITLNSFLETYALAQNCGQIMQSDVFCSSLENTVRYWYLWSRRTRNYGFFTRIVQQAEDQIHTSARQYGMQLEEQLDTLIAGSPGAFQDHPEYEEAIRTQIADQNYIVAEDWMARLRVGDFSLDIETPEAIGYLEQFWHSYDACYRKVADTSRSLAGIMGRMHVHNKDTKGARLLVDSWLNNGRAAGTQRIRQLLSVLGWRSTEVTLCRCSRAEMYFVKTLPEPGGSGVPLHPVAAFGSKLLTDGMYVVCLYGTYDCDRLFTKIRELDAVAGTKLILVDCALSGVDRRHLAFKLKKRANGMQSVCMAVDRVLICHLADCYSENTVQRRLMALGMPFSFCQPFVADSSLTMPPEIFIGRRDELLKIEQPDGVNLIYGGRQLGKSALFKKARMDIDGSQQRRAVLVDIKDLDCGQAARKLSAELMDFGILEEGEVTEDWSLLCRRIRQRLLRKDDVIRYLLVMLDEADTFIESCSACGFRPLVELKDVQQTVPGAFKFVLAGLHNIIRFNRQVALGQNAVITHFPSLKITPFSAPDAQELLIRPLSYLGFSLPSKVTVSQILATANYFPGLIQLYGQKLIESIRGEDYGGYSIRSTPPYSITDSHLRRVMADKEFVQQIREKFEITLRLDAGQGSFYYPLALVMGYLCWTEPDKTRTGYTVQDVMHVVSDYVIAPLTELDEDRIRALLQELQDLNILRSVTDDTWLLASKNFRDLLGTVDEIFDRLVEQGGDRG